MCVPIYDDEYYFRLTSLSIWLTLWEGFPTFKTFAELYKKSDLYIYLYPYSSRLLDEIYVRLLSPTKNKETRTLMNRYISLDYRCLLI